MRISDWSSDVCSSDLQEWAWFWPMYHWRIRKNRHPEQRYGSCRLHQNRTFRSAAPAFLLPPIAAWALSAPSTARRMRQGWRSTGRSEEHTSELQSLMRLTYAVFRL